MRSKPSRFDRMNEMMWEALIGSYEGSTKRECFLIWESRDVSWVGLWRLALLWACRDQWEERGYFQAKRGDISKGIKATWAKNMGFSLAKQRACKEERQEGEKDELEAESALRARQRIGGVIHQEKENHWCLCWGPKILYRGRIWQLITCWEWGSDGGEKSQC